MHEAMKEALGIKEANCTTCHHIGTESDGNYPEFEQSWEVCHKHPRMENLKGFPFQKDGVKCWSPNFWHSKYAGMIKEGEPEELDALFDQFEFVRDNVPTATTEGEND